MVSARWKSSLPSQLSFIPSAGQRRTSSATYSLPEASGRSCAIAWTRVPRLRAKSVAASPPAAWTNQSSGDFCTVSTFDGET